MSTSTLTPQEVGRLGGLAKLKNGKERMEIAQRLAEERPVLEAQIHNLRARNDALIDALLKRGIETTELVEVLRAADAKSPLGLGGVL